MLNKRWAPGRNAFVLELNMSYLLRQYNLLNKITNPFPQAYVVHVVYHLPYPLIAFRTDLMH